MSQNAPGEVLETLAQKLFDRWAKTESPIEKQSLHEILKGICYEAREHCEHLEHMFGRQRLRCVRIQQLLDASKP